MGPETANRQKITFDISITAILKVVAVILALLFLYVISDIVVIFIVAFILATLIYPAADWCAKKRIPRAIAVLLVYLVLIGLIALIVTLLIPPLVEQSGQMFSNLFEFTDSFIKRIEPLKNIIINNDLMQGGTNPLASLEASLPKAISGVFSTVTGVLGGVVSFVLILVLAFYMVIEGDALKKFFRSIAPERYQPHLVGLFTRAEHKMGLWLRGTLILGLIVGILVYVGLLILGVKYALVLAILAGILEMIPYLGPPVSAIPAVILAFSQTPAKGLLVMILYVIVQQLENHILAPKIMQKATGINPVVSILSFGIGFKVAGVLGALLAIPVATAATVFITDFIELQKKKN
ncbi:MAG: AI-2E family transporter [bacterium]